jgi:hypothetical protein
LGATPPPITFGGIDFCLERRVERQVDPERHVDRAHDDADAPAGAYHPHDLRQHPLGVALLEHRRGQCHIDGAIGQR